MCITPKRFRYDGRVLYYCGNCDRFWAGDYNSENTYCPKCGEDTIKTRISALAYESLSDSGIEAYKEEYRKKWEERENQ